MLNTLLSHKHFKHMLYVLVVLLIVAGFLFSPRLATSPQAIEGGMLDKEIPALILPEGKISEVLIGATVFAVEIADTVSSRAKGLSGKEGLGVNEGLLFVFQKPGEYSFWMKDMLFSIDIAWISENGQIIYIEEGVTPDSFPESFGPRADSLYVLEVSKGVFEREGIVVGDFVSFK